MPVRTRPDGTLIFADYPDFRPNVTPKDMFRAGIFAGTYFRPIRSAVTKRNYRNAHKEFPASWFATQPYDRETKDNSINLYGVWSGSSLRDWERKGWIDKRDPYGWVQWYCRFYLGRRCPDDERQIARWKAIAGPKGRFRTRLISMCKAKRKKCTDISVSPVIRQLLLQWGYEVY